MTTTAKITILEIDGKFDLDTILKGLPFGTIVVGPHARTGKTLFGTTDIDAMVNPGPVNVKTAAEDLEARWSRLRAAGHAVKVEPNTPTTIAVKESKREKEDRLTKLAQDIGAKFKLRFGPTGKVLPHKDWKPATPRAVYCPITGKEMVMTKRWFRAIAKATPQDIRDLYGMSEVALPAVASGYAQEKSQYAKFQGFGTNENKAGKACSKKQIHKRMAAA